MTPEAMAEQIIPKGTHPYREDADDLRVEIEAAIRAAVAGERERCAKLAEAYSRPVLMDGMEILRLKTTVANALDIAKAIRGGAP